jgi:CrcB protein
MWKPVLVILLGSAPGALLRCALGTRVNSLFPSVPPSTLTANLTAATPAPMRSPSSRKCRPLRPSGGFLVVTGFCGGVTTFSTSFAKVAAVPQQQYFAMAMVASVVHVSRSLLMTLAGVA